MDDDAQESGEYEKMLLLEELESLIEEMDEVGVSTGHDQRLGELQIKIRGELKQRIANLHAELDANED